MHEYSSARSSASDIRMASSSNLNLLISSSREEEEAAPSPIMACPRSTCCNGWAASGIPCGIGWLTGGRSCGARKPWPRDVYASQTVVVCSDRVADI